MVLDEKETAEMREQPGSESVYLPIPSFLIISQTILYIERCKFERMTQASNTWHKKQC